MDTNLQISNCDVLTNQYYHRLCSVLKIQPQNSPTTQPFTGNKATDILKMKLIFIKIF